MMSQKENPSSISQIQPQTPMDCVKTDTKAEITPIITRQLAFVGHQKDKLNSCPLSEKSSQVCVKDSVSIHDLLPSFDGEPLPDSSNMIHLPYDHRKQVYESDHADGSDPALASSKALLKGKLKIGDEGYQPTNEYALTLASFKATLKAKFKRGEEEDQPSTEDALTLALLKTMVKGKVKRGEKGNQLAGEYGLTLASFKAMLKEKFKKGEEENQPPEKSPLAFPISSTDYVDQYDPTLASFKAVQKGKLQVRSEEKNWAVEKGELVYKINSSNHVDGSDPTLASLKKALCNTPL